MVAAGPLLTIITPAHDVISAPTVTPVEGNNIETNIAYYDCTWHL
ncbi:MAG: hypothetical protein AAGU17_13465 [Anaerolineaceae bacterium]